MRRSRVLSLSSIFGNANNNGQGHRKSSYDDASMSPTIPAERTRKLTIDTITPQASAANLNEFAKDSPSPTVTQQQRNRSDSTASGRPMSMIQTYSPVQMGTTADTLPELQPVFSLLNSHSNRLYQEGYFLKLHDLDTRGRPSADRSWTECFAQLVGTVLSLWDAAALDAAGEEGEVLPTFINISDASIKMIESLPMHGSKGGTLQNVLSISTAANNRYLLHFNSLNSLTQWTAGIRLAIYEHATLLEAYTGSLIAGKGKLLNNIRVIMERTKFKTEDWARVRFGAGTPWRRCWCVINPPDEKDWAKAQKQLKKKNAYERKVVIPKGNIKFYDTRRINKKTQPIATISDAYAAYAIYPQSMPLIDQSSLVKLEGLITVHGTPEATTEGFLFVMPEVHPAVTGFEMMLRWLFPVFDTFALYGRPGKLIADPLDQRGLMFAFPRDRRGGYLDILDVSGLIHTEGSQTWSERQWRQELKKLTSHRMNTAEAADDGSPMRSRRRNTISRTSLPSLNGPAVRFDGDGRSSSPASRGTSPSPYYDELNIAPHRRSPTLDNSGFSPGHNRSASDANGYKPSRLSYEANANDRDEPPRVPVHGMPLAHRRPPPLSRINSEAETPPADSYEEVHAKAEVVPVTPVVEPPSFMHNPNSRPANQPYQAPELRRATSEMDLETIQQMNEAIRSGESPTDEPRSMQYNGSRQEVDIDATNVSSLHADVLSRKGLVNSSSVDDSHPLPQPPKQLDEAVTETTRQDPIQGRSPPVPQHRQMPQMDRPADNTLVVPLTAAALADRQVIRKPSSQSIKRKPIPSRNVTPTTNPAIIPPSSPSSVGGFSDEVIDNEALEAILQQERSPSITTDSSVDYASTTKSESPKKRVERPRMGRLKTVGDETIKEEEIQSRRQSVFDSFRQESGQEVVPTGEVPVIDFGPTYVYKPSPNSRPTTSGTLSGIAGAEDAPGSRSASRMSASPANHSPYFGGSTDPSPAGGMTPVDMPDNRRSMVGSPTGTSPNEQSQSLTPEQWVQYRASLASQPQAPIGGPRTPMHVRKSSAGRLPSAGSTPPLSRSPSGDWTQQTQRTPPRVGSRSNSYGAGAYTNAQSPGGLVESTSSKSLTAKEQMQVARATGTPLVEVKKKKPAYQVESPGLYGALEAREREKAANKYGMSSAAVQQAIVARQQQQQQQQQAEMQAQMHAQMQAQQFLNQQATQAAQAAHAAQLAHYQAQQRQYQQAFGGPGNGNIRPGSQSPFGFAQQQQQRPGGQSNRSLMYMDQHQQQAGVYGDPGPYQQSNRGPYYGYPNQPRY
ncbi:hypothetical protein MBLNU457_7782t2 [Dothideomycetes sp. NU457]